MKLRSSRVIALVIVLTFLFTSIASAAPYSVQSGDNLWKISQKYGTSVGALYKANNLKSYTIYIGQKLQVPDQYTHFVSYGDTLWKIAQRYNVTIQQLISYNGITNASNLRIGQIIKIPKQTSSNSKVDQLIQAGLKYKGVKYLLGADYNKDGTYKMDCSSFTQKAYADIGIKITRSSRSQYKYPPGRTVSRSEIKRGDLLFFDYTKDGTIDHVAIYYGNDQLLHTYRNPQGVELAPFLDYWKQRYVGAKRIIE